MKSGKIISWLHISDLHIREDDRYNRDIVLSSLLNDIRKLKDSSVLKADFTCITGDLVYAGKEQEFSLANGFIKELCESSGIHPSNTFLVPGNHEIERHNITPLMRKAASVLTTRDEISNVIGDPSDVKKFTDRHSTYHRFIKECFPWAKDLLPSDLCFTINLTTDEGYHVALIGLNSVWTSSSNSVDDRGKLIIGERQVRSALEQVSRPCDLTIALMHHPLSLYIDPIDKRDVETLLRRKCDFLLTGHFHEGDVVKMICPDSEACFICAGGAYVSRKETMSYNYVEVDVEKGIVAVHFRKYSDRGGGGYWVADESMFEGATNGLVMMPLPKKGILDAAEFGEYITPGYH